VVKVLPKGANSLGAVQGHLGYIGRDGELDLETDDGEILRGKHVGNDLQEDWNLDLIEQREKPNLTSTKTKQPPRLVHKVTFSVPAGTPPDKVFAAVRNFAREEFGLKHRYVMALHTDEPHPHVHLVIKAVSNQGQRLHIRKATLREWRAGFARHLRELGVPANATQRQVRGVTSYRKPDGIYRARLRGESTQFRNRVKAVAQELKEGKLRIESGKAKQMRTRDDVRRAWLAVSDTLIRQGHPEISAQVRRHVERMPPPLTEKEYIAAKMLERVREPRVREREFTR
jgi:Relaxase/Mobilisation nuclease domain